MLSPELNRPLTRRNILPSIIGFFVGIGFSAYACTQNYPTGQFICVFILSYAVGVIFHEVGHASAALALGGHVNYVRIGFRLTKRPPWNVRFCGLNWSLYGMPFSGSVQSSFYTTDKYRLRRLIVIAAGPFMNALLLGIGIALVYFASPPIQPQLLVGWIFANGCLFIYALTPKMIRSYGQLIPNDGLNLWHTLHQSDDEIRRIVTHSVITRDLQIDTAAAERMSTEELLAKHEAEPGNIALLWNLTNKFHANNNHRYPDYVMKLIALPGMPVTAVSGLIDECLTWQLHLGPPKKTEVADELSQRLLKLDDSISARGTRGSVLVDLGRVKEGKAMLHDVLAKTESTIDKTYSNIFLALAEKQDGNLGLAREHAQKAAMIDPNCPALNRVSDLLSPQPMTEKAK